jgi:hypothetical protein
MIVLDWLEQLLVPCPHWLREMGYVRELIGIRRRHRRWRWAWEPHCERSRNVIRAAVQRCPQRRKAVVLGSGFLHDVPVGELSASFREVILVDVLHPLATRWCTHGLKNVLLLAEDVSGSVEGVWLAVEQRTPLPAATPCLFVDDAEVDLVVSLNLLSQLPCLPEQYLLQARTHPAEEIAAWCRAVVQAHLDYLRRLPGVVALIADVQSRTISASGTEVGRRSTLYGVDFPWEGERWIWPLVPRKRAFPHHGEHLVVAAFPDVKEVMSG